MMTEKTKTEIKETITKAGLGEYALCTHEKTGEPYIVLLFKTGAFIKGNWKENMKLSLANLVVYVQANLDKFSAVVD